MAPTLTEAAAPETAGQRRSRLLLAAVMVTAGGLHFVIPDTYARIVPKGLGDARTIVYVSGVAEAVAGVLLAVPRTSRLGGWCTAAVLVSVFPANVQMAVDAGVPGTSGASGELVPSLIAWLRLPLQLPLVAWAVGIARRGAGGRSRPPAPPT